jgi:HSP20 family protein
VTQFTFIRPAESGELASDIRELFEDLATSLARDERAYSGECHPALDVLETDAAVEVVMDVSGVPPQAIRVMFRGEVLVIAGEKAPAPTGPHQSYHLVEREFGRFARAVRVPGAFDVARASADIRNGELLIVLPKIDERRGRAHRIPITTTGAAPKA